MKKLVMILITCFSALTWSLGAGAMTAGDIVGKANQAAYYQAEDGRANVHMVITDSLGRTRERNMTILRKDDENDIQQKYYVYFDKPNDVKGMSYMVWKNPGARDDRWLFLPALDLVRRVASSDKRSSFVGSHFAYEEISGRGSQEDNHVLEEETDEYYKIKSTPKDPGSVEFSYFVTWIDKKTFLPMKAELYDKNEKHYKTIEALEVKEIEGFPTITRMMATNLNSNGNTVSEFSGIKYNVGLEDGIFTERFLRRPPRQYLGE
ncbi:MAG: outer membrane lipoprotein-sorting protein [Candidatus Tantalella remota]|nr:outer membrane lipoprotein-sorting protein [Candidatus Tantalella remota]